VEQVSGWNTRAYCYLGTCGLVGPTIELYPGDSFSLTLVNSLGANPTGEDTTMNSMHSPNTTNLHTHGLHIDPAIDTIFTKLAPGTSHTYLYEVPSNHAPGLYWYHDHTHGSSALKIMGACLSSG
jgi:FtsP/CotA-like multicopper oxidase with cupredoxin domain